MRTAIVKYNNECMYMVWLVYISLMMINTQTSCFVNGVGQHVRKTVILRQNNLCGMCKNNFTTMKPHEIHHINHECKDNNITNLLALCANCHAAHHRYGVPANPFYDNDH